jgi:MGT family glycosyltransferase
VKVLHAFWDGGGNTAPQLAIARTLVARGHDVRMLGHGVQQAKVEATGARFLSYRHAPDADSSQPETDLMRDWEAKTPIGAFARLRDRLMFGPSGLFARDVLEAVEKEPADVVVWDYLLVGAGIAAEKSDAASVSVVHTVYPLPRPGVPPFGVGLQPARGAAGRARDAVLTRVLTRSFMPGLKAANRVRADLGLEPFGSPFNLLDGADLNLVLTSEAFDFAGPLPDTVRYTGPLVESASPTAWDSPWPADDPRPLVLASFSTTFMAQQDLATRAVEALGRLPVRGLLTAGPAIDATALPQRENVAVREFVPHPAVLPEASVVITHAGLGTVHAALSAGVPLVCIPHGRDQDDVTARVVFHGAGVRAGRNVGPEKLARLVSAVLADGSYRANAQRLAAAFAAEGDGAIRAAELVEGLAGTGTA